MNPRVLLLAAFTTMVLLTTGCLSSGSFEIIGNVRHTDGKLAVAYTADLCYVLQYGTESDSDCTPISTDVNGQFSTEIFSFEGHRQSFSGYQLYLRTSDGAKFSGQVIKENIQNDGLDQLFGNLFVNFTVPGL